MYRAKQQQQLGEKRRVTRMEVNYSSCNFKGQEIKVAILLEYRGFFLLSCYFVSLVHIFFAFMRLGDFFLPI